MSDHVSDTEIVYADAPPVRARWRGVIPVASVAVLLAIWFAGAAYAQSRLLPGPVEVAKFLVDETLHGELMFHLGMTLFRVVASFTLSMAVGCVVGLFMGQSQAVNRALDPWLIVLLNIPALVVIILAYVWFGLTEAAAIGAVALNKMPNTVVTIREGARSLDPQLEEMAQAYRLTGWEKLRHVTLPQLQPYFAAASRSGIALIWKIVLVVELLGRSNGVGFQLNLYFQLFDVTAILGYTFAFIVVMLAIELLVVQPFERYSTRWRVKPA